METTGQLVRSSFRWVLSLKLRCEGLFSKQDTDIRTTNSEQFSSDIPTYPTVCLPGSPSGSDGYFKTQDHIDSSTYRILNRNKTNKWRNRGEGR